MIEVINLKDENHGAALFAVRGLGGQGSANLLERSFHLIILYADQQGGFAPP